MHGISFTTEQFGQILWTASWQAALLAAFVAVACRLLRRQLKPAWQFALWSLVFVRLACPMLPASVCSVQNLWASSETPAAADVSPPAPPERSSIAWRAEQGDEVRVEKEGYEIENVQAESADETVSSDPHSATTQPVTTSGFKLSFWPSMMACWGSITLLLLTRQFRMWRRLVRLASKWLDVTDEQTVEILADYCRSMKLRRPVRLLRTEGQVGPAVLGVWNPCVIVPADILATVSEHELRMLLLHELEHIRRWDVLWDRLATLLTIVHWFNPVAWWARKCLRDAREQACDAAVLMRMGEAEAKPYGQLVLTLAERQSHRRADAVLVGMHGRSGSLSQRIEQIVGYRPSRMKHDAIGLALTVTLIAGGLTGAQKSQTNPTKGDNSRSDGVDNANTQKDQQDYNLSGVCHDADDKPLADVRVRLFRVSMQNKTRELVEDIKTETDGTFHFENLPAPQRVDFDYGVFKGLPLFDPFYVIAADKPGYASTLIDHRFPEQVKDRINIKLLKAGKLSGRVTDPQGQPIAGADVFVRSFPSYDPIEDLMSTKTDADGRYVLDDLPLRDSNEETTTDSEGKPYGVVTEILFRVTHPDYGRVHPNYSFIPSKVDVTLEPAARVEGIVSDKVTGKPAPGIRVELRGVGSTNDFVSGTTDKTGRYVFSNLAKGQFNIWAEAPERTCYAIESLTVEAGKTYRDQNLSLIEGSWIKGKVVDHVTGKPITEADGYPVQIRGYGPSHPKPGATYGAPVDQNGEFKVRVAPGTNSLHVSPYSIGKRVLDGDKYHKGFEVGEDEIVSIEFRVLPETPEKSSKTSEVRFPIPVPEEREAAAAIRRLGGWYQVDENRHVIEVNMVYHYENENTDQEVRYDNDQKQTDEALSWVAQFPKLKRLYLSNGQATDGGMRHLAELEALEVFFAWDAHKLGDEGVQHLLPLKALKQIHISESLIGDESLTIFGQLPAIEKLSIQGNHFTDAGIPQLIKLQSLKELWLGLGESQLTDKACSSLSHLSALEELDLQNAHISDRGIEQLSKLVKLRQLYLGGTEPDEPLGITDESVRVLTQFTSLERLSLSKCRLTDEGARQLAAMPKMKRLSLSGSAVTPEAKAELKEKYPDIRINITDR